jgi:hypothetical protein
MIVSVTKEIYAGMKATADGHPRCSTPSWTLHEVASIFHICLHTYIYIYICICMYVCMYIICMYVCICMYVYIYIGMLHVLYVEPHTVFVSRDKCAALNRELLRSLIFASYSEALYDDLNQAKG